MAVTPLIKQIIESMLFASEQPIHPNELAEVLAYQEETRLSVSEIKKVLEEMISDYQGKAIELVEVASGYRFQVRKELMPWLQRFLQEKPSKYSRATLETLAIIAYRQPITRGEIEAIRGVSVSTSILKTLQDREWIKIVGHRELPGKPALYATTKSFLDYFQLKTLAELPTLPEASETASLSQLGFNLPDEVEKNVVSET